MARRKCKLCKVEFTLEYPRLSKIYCDKHSLIKKGISGRDYVRTFARIRDKETCQRCKKVWKNGRKFDVHHLKGMCGKKSRGYDKKSEIKNLITYCHHCHMTLHSVQKKIKLGISGDYKSNWRKSYSKEYWKSKENLTK